MDEEYSSYMLMLMATRTVCELKQHRDKTKGRGQDKHLSKWNNMLQHAYSEL